MSWISSTSNGGEAAGSGRVSGERLRRFMKPRSVAVIGASENTERYAVRALLNSDLDVFLVNPRRDSVLGRATYPSLTAIEQPIDAVLTLVNARAAVDVVREAAGLDIGGVAINAAGFAEVGGAGVALQAELVEAAGSMPVLGPNCNGYVNAVTGAFLAGAPKLPLRAGGVGFVTHSGGFITDASVSAVDRLVGFSSLISTGNEAVTDMVDYIDYLVDDEETRVITLVIERIRRPQAFFRAVARAREAGKPVIALKLGRSERGRAVAKSHTGAILGEGWVYDAAFAQHGVITANDLDALLDKAMFFDQLAQGAWPAGGRLAVLTVSGGAASLASDVSEAEGVALPELPAMESVLKEALPLVGTTNPVDLTGFVMGRPDVIRQIADAYLASDEVDAVMALWTLGLESEGFAKSFTHPFVAAAEAAGKPVILSALAAGRVSGWAEGLRRPTLAVGHGVRASARGFSAMAEFARARTRSATLPDYDADRLPFPEEQVVESGGDAFLTFSAAMDLLQAAGVTVAPYRVVAPGEPAGAGLPFAGPYVVKVADCPHRTDIGAVKVGVQPGDLAAAVEEMRAVAEQHGFPLDVAVQPMLHSDGELFIGGQGDGELGPVVLSGLGGIHVEALGATGRLVPASEADIDELIDEMDGVGVFRGARGQQPWDRAAFADTIVGVGRLLLAGASWIDTLDVNPLLHTSEGFVAVDGLVYVRKPA